MKCLANNDVIRRRGLGLISHSRDRRSGRSIILRSLDSWSSVLSTTLPSLLGEIEQLYGRCVVLTSLLSDGWRMTCLLEREREKERERERLG